MRVNPIVGFGIVMFMTAAGYGLVSKIDERSATLIVTVILVVVLTAGVGTIAFVLANSVRGNAKPSVKRVFDAGGWSDDITYHEPHPTYSIRPQQALPPPMPPQMPQQPQAPMMAQMQPQRQFTVIGDDMQTRRL